MVLSFFQDIFCAKTRNKDSEFDQEDPLTEDDFAWNSNPKEKYLALDLDLTIVHCTKLTVEAPSAAGEKSIHRFSVKPRPYLMEFLEKLSKHYTIVIYTSSTLDYALSILRFLKIARFVKHLLYRAHCIEVKDGQFVKDLSLLNVPASDVILIDDSYPNYMVQPANCLLIQPFLGDSKDTHLLNLIPFLLKLSVSHDMRGVSKKYSEYLNRLSEKESNGDKRRLVALNQPCQEEISGSIQLLAEESTEDDEKGQIQKKEVAQPTKNALSDEISVFKIDIVKKLQSQRRVLKLFSNNSSSK